MGEEGEVEMDEILKNLDPETREKFEKGELNEDDLIGMGLIPPIEDYGVEGDDDELDYGEEGEDEDDDEGSSEPVNAGKRQKHSSDDDEE